MKRFGSFAIAAAAAFAVGMVPVAAQQKAEQACAADIQTYCANVPQGQGRVAECLKSNQQKLSPTCQQGLAAATTLMKEVVQACSDDLHRYCAGAAPGTVRDCLKSNFGSLSFQCKRELFEARKGT